VKQTRKTRAAVRKKNHYCPKKKIIDWSHSKLSENLALFLVTIKKKENLAIFVF